MEEREIKSFADENFDYNDFVIPDKCELVLKAVSETRQVTEITDWPKEGQELLHKYEKLWKHYMDLMICVKTQVDDNDFFFQRNCGRQCSLAAICSNISEPSKAEVDPDHGAMLLKAAEHGEKLLAEHVAGNRIGLEQSLRQNTLQLAGQLDYKCYIKITVGDGENEKETNCSHAVGFKFTIREHPRACDVFELLLKALAGSIDKAFLLVCYAYGSDVKLYEVNTHGYTNGDTQQILHEFKERVKLKNIKGRYYQLAFVEVEDIDNEL